MDQHTLDVLEFGKIVDQLKDYAETNIGREILINIGPVKNINYVRESLKEVTTAKELLKEFGRPPFGGIRDLREILKKPEKEMVLSTDEISRIYSSLVGFGNLKDYFNNIIEETDPELINNLYSIIIDKAERIEVLKGLEREIENTIDEYGEVKDSASSRLKSLRRKKDKIEGQIRDKLESIVRGNKYQTMLQDSLITRRENRYVVPVKKEYRNSFSGIVHDQSSSGMTIFMEPMSVVKLNNRLREVKSEEESEIYRILQQLTQKIQKMISPIKNNLKLSSVLDVAFARARYSDKIGGIAPEINQDGEINIKQGRHPLLQNEPVPIDVEVGDDFNTLVITGPNTGGKTVSLKTIGLFILMTEAGLHIPADRGTSISIFQKVFADIGDEQSIEQNLSTFSSHMNKIKRFLKQAGESTLVLLDELGVGTDPREGAALGIAILEQLKDNNVTTVATTHYSQLKSYAYSTSGVENASVEFDLETLRPTYRLIMGVPGGSNAFEIALRLGLPEHLIEQAKGLTDEGELQVESIISDLNKQRKKYENMNKELDSEKRKVERLKDEYEEKLNRMEDKEERVIEKAHQKAEEIVNKTKKKSKRIIKDLKESDYTSRPEVDRKATSTHEKIKNLDKEVEDDKDNKDETKQEIDKSIKKGDLVRVMSLGQKGEVLEINEAKEEATIQAGAMKVTASLEDLSKAETQDVKKDEMVKKYKVKKSESISPRIDIRGERYEDAQRKVDKYLDDAFLAGFKKLEIVHGKGTGALREAVSEMLDNHSHVKSYRLGRQKEGGSGVTIVTLGNG